MKNIGYLPLIYKIPGRERRVHLPGNNGKDSNLGAKVEKLQDHRGERTGDASQ